MNHMLKKAISLFIATTSLAVCTLANFATAAEVKYTDNPITMGSNPNARSYHDIYLTGNSMVYLETISGPRTVTVYGDPEGGTISIYYKKQNSNTYYPVKSFDPSGNTPSASLTLSSGKYDIYVTSTYATPSNPITGFVNIY